MRNLKRYIIIAILASTAMYLSGCASLTYNPHSQTEKIKMTFKK
jgi:PBP1b-binding outer membrane lipoprotein LpoB